MVIREIFYIRPLVVTIGFVIKSSNNLSYCKSDAPNTRSFTTDSKRRFRMEFENGEAPLETIELPLDSAEGLESFGAGENPKSVPKDAAKSEGWCKTWWRWIPTSQVLLEQAESKILSYVKTKYEGKYVDIGPVLKESKCKWWNTTNCKSSEERKIWTLVFNKEQIDNTPIVLVHGLCASVGLWCLNIDALSKSRTVYALDLLGFGRSSRPTFSTDAMDAEAQHVESLEAWRKEMKLDRFILLGHSMGAFLSASYAMKYPDHVCHLVLADPWGIPLKPTNLEQSVIPGDTNTKSLRYRFITSIGQKINALSIVRVAGPIGPSMIGKVRPDLLSKFKDLNQDGKADVSQYIYHCNAQNPSGEEAFRTMMDFFGWAKNPIESRLNLLPADLPLTMIYGDNTWLQQLSEHEVKKLRQPNAPTAVFSLEHAGHHVYADNQQEFNSIVEKLSIAADKLKNK